MCLRVVALFFSFFALSRTERVAQILGDYYNYLPSQNIFLSDLPDSPSWMLNVAFFIICLWLSKQIPDWNEVKVMRLSIDLGIQFTNHDKRWILQRFPRLFFLITKINMLHVKLEGRNGIDRAVPRSQIMNSPGPPGPPTVGGGGGGGLQCGTYKGRVCLNSWVRNVRGSKLGKCYFGLIRVGRSGFIYIYLTYFYCVYLFTYLCYYFFEEHGAIFWRRAFLILDAFRRYCLQCRQLRSCIWVIH